MKKADKRIIIRNGMRTAVLDNVPIPDAQTALDLIAEVGYYDACDRIAVRKEAFPRAFFDLKTGMAGEILQKFSNYSKKLAIIGDFADRSSAALRDFIRECNRGHSVFFVPTEEDAVARLCGTV
ncbi:hypothetical protein FACS1894211_13500 [Clostridia bacterium]|nr:hypothetical protein FACS1894211_13500 [Clostridia bacterium]